MRSFLVFAVLVVSVAEFGLSAEQQAKKLTEVSETTANNLEQARQIIKSGFDSKDYKVRIEAVTAAGMVGRNEAMLSKMVDLLDDKNADVRLATVHAISDLHTEKCEISLKKTVAEDKAPEVAFAAAKVLATWRDPEGKQALMEVYEGTRKTRSNLIAKEKRTILEQFHSYPSAMMFVLSKGMGYVPVPGAGEGFSAITTLLKDPGLSDRASVLLILCKSKNKESRELLEKALKDDNWSVRAVATQMISQTAATELRGSLPPLFDDKDDKVRFRAAGAYLHLELVREDKIQQGK